MKFKFKRDDLSGNVLGVIRTENSLGVTDNAYIPFDPDNIDYQDYLKWVAAGNTAEAAD
tara:strand:+ start:1021 stop:1197 length:177 start_codon:yes stop_codon:yes gene_type:complete